MISTDLVRQEAKAPSVVPSSFLEQIEGAKAILERATNADEVRRIRDVAMVAEAYAAAKLGREAVCVASELRLRSERVAGAIRKSLPRTHASTQRNRSLSDSQILEAKALRESGLSFSDIGTRFGKSEATIYRLAKRNWTYYERKGSPYEYKKFDEDFGISVNTGYVWQQLSLIPEDKFDRLISESIEFDRSMAAKEILRRSQGRGKKRVAPCIYRREDGLLVLEWSRDGIIHKRSTGHSDLAKAKTELNEARGNLKKVGGAAGRSVSDAYAYVRRALESLDRADRQAMDAVSRRALDRAISSLHRAEDDIVKAIV